MAGWNIEVKLPLRPCKIGERDAIFHGWFPIAKPIPPSNLRGGHPGGQLSQVIGLVEWNNGTVHTAYPHEIRFLDTEKQMEEFAEDYNHEAAQAADLPDDLKPMYEDLLNELRRGNNNEKDA